MSNGRKVQASIPPPFECLRAKGQALRLTASKARRLNLACWTARTTPVSKNGHWRPNQKTTSAGLSFSTWVSNAGRPARLAKVQQFTKRKTMQPTNLSGGDDSQTYTKRNICMTMTESPPLPCALARLQRECVVYSWSRENPSASAISISGHAPAMERTASTLGSTLCPLAAPCPGNFYYVAALAFW